MKSDNGFSIRSNLHRNNNEDNSGDSFLHSNINAGSFYNGNNGSFMNGSGSFMNGSGSFVNEISSSGAYVSGVSNNNSIGGATLGTSGSFVNNNGSFVNNAPISTTAAMPPPRPVKRTPANNHTNHNVPHSAGMAGINKPGGFVPLMRRRRYWSGV